MERGRQILRQWKILRAIEGARGRGLSLADLMSATDECCSERTIYRDLDQLQAAGFPLLNEEGRWRVLTSGEGAWSIPVDPTQVLALTLTDSLLEPIANSWIAAPLRELRERLFAMLTPDGRAYCTEMRRTAIATLFASCRYDQQRAELDAIQEAIARQHRLRIRYAAPTREPEDRTVEPYCTWYAAGRLYVIAYCCVARDMRTFAVQRIQSAEVLNTPFDPDPNFDPAQFVRLGFGVFHGPVHHVVIDFSSRIAHLIRERRHHHSQRIVDIDAGVRLTMDAAGLPEIAAWVASFGGEACAIAPRELIDAVISLHRAGLQTALSSGVVTSDVIGP